MKNMLVIDGKEIQLSDETVKEIKEKLGINNEVDWLKIGIVLAIIIMFFLQMI